MNSHTTDAQLLWNLSFEKSRITYSFLNWRMIIAISDESAWHFLHNMIFVYFLGAEFLNILLVMLLKCQIFFCNGNWIKIGISCESIRHNAAFEKKYLKYFRTNIWQKLVSLKEHLHTSFFQSTYLSYSDEFQSKNALSKATHTHTPFHNKILTLRSTNIF